ncbi:hypothetical protein V8E53_009101 [Lactarius tabidus]
MMDAPISGLKRAKIGVSNSRTHGFALEPVQYVDKLNKWSQGVHKCHDLMQEPPVPNIFLCTPYIKASPLFFSFLELHTRHTMYTSIRVIAILLFTASTVSPALSASLSSDLVARDASPGIRDHLHPRQDPLDQKCQAFYGSEFCYPSWDDNSGVDGALGSCVCPYTYEGQASQAGDCAERYDNGNCYYDAFFEILPGPVWGACACPLP